MSAATQFLDDLRIVLRGRDFRALFATRLASQTGDGMFEAGLASLFFFSPQRAATAGGIAAAFGVAILPYTVVGPFAGVLLDRWRRRQVLVWANVVRAVLVGVVAVMVGRGAVGVPLYVVVLGCLSINRFFLAGLGASLPHVVAREELVMANAVSPTSGTIVSLLGAGVAFGMRTAIGAGNTADAVILSATAAVYLGAAALGRRMHRDLLGPDDAERLPWQDVLAAARSVATGLAAAGRHVWERRPAFDALAVVGGQRFAYGLVTVAMVLLARASFADPADADAGARVLAAAFGVSGLGFGLAAVITPVVTRRIAPARWIVICNIAASVLAVVFAATLTLPVALGAGFVVGIAMQGSKICVDAIVQGSVDDAFRGRVMSFYDLVFNLAFVAAAAVCALMLPPDGRSAALFLGVGTIYLLAGILYGRARLSG